MIGEATAMDIKGLRWVSASDSRLEIKGLPFFGENEGNWWRFPKRADGAIPSYVWETSKSSSGARILFRSNSSSVAVRYTCHTPAGNHPNIHSYGEAAIDAYVDGNYIASLVPTGVGEVEEYIFAGVEKGEREICLYLPLFAQVTIKEIGLDSGATIQSPAAFAVSRPVVFYGTSITHGGCASHPGLSYEAILCRRLNLDFVNFGFNGCGRGEKEVGAIISEVDASCFVLDFSQNNDSVESLRENYLPFINVLRSRHPQTPIICVTPIYWTPELPGAARGNIHESMREVIREAVKTRIGSGDNNIYLVEGYELLGPEQGDGLTDGLHPNTLGFYWMANGLESYIKNILRL
jgi:lysophospholipase L1-like esterase